jgi:hypothetical protein
VAPILAGFPELRVMGVESWVWICRATG